MKQDRDYMGEVVVKVYRTKAGKFDVEYETAHGPGVELARSLLDPREIKHSKSLLEIGLSRLIDYFTFTLNPEHMNTPISAMKKVRGR